MDDFLSNDLGLKDSYAGTMPEKNLHGFNNKNRDRGNYVFDKDPNRPSGEGDISATAEDLLAYAQMNMREEKPYFALCHQRHASAKSLSASLLTKAAGIGNIDMGLGWMLYKDNNRVLWHSGDSDSFSSYLGFDKDKQAAAVVLSNYRINAIKLGASILEHLRKEARHAD
jgi:CubicO group peptidase (beta-lactamase class C family)